jgi:hypothetical protein
MRCVRGILPLFSLLSSRTASEMVCLAILLSLRNKGSDLDLLPSDRVPVVHGPSGDDRLSVKETIL